MAEFEFMSTTEDYSAILEAVLAPRDIVLYVDLVYAKPEPFTISRLSDEAKATVMKRPHLLACGRSFSKTPPAMTRRNGGPAAGTYYVDFSKGGPGIALRLPYCYEDSGRLILKCGYLLSPRYYLDTETGQWKAPDETLRNAYRDLVRRIKKLCHQMPESSVWITDAAHRLAEQGKAQLLGLRRRSVRKPSEKARSRGSKRLKA